MFQMRTSSAVGSDQRLPGLYELPAVSVKADMVHRLLPARAPRLLLLRTHAEHPHERIERHPQIANVLGPPAQRLIIRANHPVDQQNCHIPSSKVADSIH